MIILYKFMKNILLTGATGFVGSNLVNNLSKNHKVYVTIRSKIYKKKMIKNSNIIYLYFKNHHNLNTKLKSLKIDTVIHCATHYVKKHNFLDIKKIIKGNIEFGIILLENLNSMKVKKFINFTTNWENFNGKINFPYNFYASSKIAFKAFIDFYKQREKKIKFYNIFISDTFGTNDRRIKIVNLIKKNYHKNKTLKIFSKNLYINLTNIKDIVSAIKILLSKNIQPNNYALTNKISFKIFDIINKLVLKKKSKLKFYFLSKKILKEKIYKFKKIPNWKPKFSSINHLINFILYE